MVKYIQNYVLYESIGSGVYGKVYRAINNNDKKEYAIKVIPINKFKQNKKLQECTVNEINILSNIQAHPNIIKYYDMLKTSNNFYFIYEYCNGGTLENLLAKQVKLNQQNVLLIFKQLLQAFQILNKYNIMHRDMKPDNIFFHNGVIKLGDFGFCKNLNSADQMTKTMLGSPIYMAPEVLKGEIYSNKADIWSLGVVLFEMIFGMCPFQSNSIANLIQVLNSKQLLFPGPISPFLKNLIIRMLTKDPLRRISWMQIFQIKINSQGQIQSQKITNKINSLSQAKILDQGQNQLNSIKNLAKIQTDEPPRDFKKNRNVSSASGATNTTTVAVMGGNSNISSNVPNISNMQTINYIHGTPQQQQQQIDQRNVIQQQQQQNGLSINNSNNGNMNPNINPNMITPTNNKIINQIYMNQSQPQSQQPQQQQQSNQKPNYTYTKQIKVSQEHKLVLQGVRIAMEIIDIKLPNHMGYAHLILTRCLTILTELLATPKTKKQIIQFFQRQIKQIQSERQSIVSKMFAYELKGLQDWKKYLRGKFFEEESTIIYWYKMVTFLNGSYGNHHSNGAADVVKQILY